MAMKLISNKALREFSALHPDSQRPLQDFRRLIASIAFGAGLVRVKAVQHFVGLVRTGA
jgi:mRNA-degrading endonuclease HigB of HigAB toxin-antitoxin module